MMNKLITLIWVICIGAVVSALIIYINNIEIRKTTYDCRLVEISPDYPQAIKDGCRKLMMFTTRIAA